MNNNLARLGPPQYPGFPYEQRRTLVSGALGVGATVVLPGPAAGFLRVYDQISATSDTIAGVLATVTTVLQPANLRLSSTFTGATTNTAAPTPIGAGETIEIVNGGANAGQYAASYVDVPLGNVTLVRQAFSDAATSVIPAAAAGFANRILFVSQVFSAGTAFGPIGRMNCFNADAVAHTVEVLLGSALIGRSASANAGASATPIVPARLNVTAATGALNFRTGEAINTTNPHVLLAYETIQAP